MGDINVNISPSGLYEAKQCQRHLWLKHNRGIGLPDRPFPGIFNVVDRAMKKWMEALDPSSIDGMPIGKVKTWSGKLTSVPLTFSDLGVSFHFGGYIDGYVEHDDGTVSIVDAKFTTEKKSKPGAHAETYATQLGAYTYIFENPMTSVPGSTVRDTGLLCFAPDGDFGSVDAQAVLSGKVWYVPVECSADSRVEFVRFMRGLAETIALPDEPPRESTCSTCQYEEKILGLDD